MEIIRSGNALNQGPCVIGIDEAGRGPVLGPMVYTAAVCMKDDEKKLRELGCDDSKSITARDRDDILSRLESAGPALFYTRVLDAEELGRKMLRKSPYNLNAISHDTAAELVRAILDSGAVVEALYVDTVGSPESYRSWLCRQFPEVPSITVESKADSTYAVVGAASIVAKTTRDRALKHWSSDELTEDLRGGFGSGYPGDPATIDWLRRACDPYFGFPSLVRFSWNTTKNMLESKGAVTVLFDEASSPDATPDIRAHFKVRRLSHKLAKFYSNRHLREDSGFLSPRRAPRE